MSTKLSTHPFGSLFFHLFCGTSVGTLSNCTEREEMCSNNYKIAAKI